MFQITDIDFRLINHQCGVEYLIYKKKPSATWDPNMGLMSESPVFYHYTNNFPVIKRLNISEYLENSNCFVYINNIYIYFSLKTSRSLKEPKKNYFH